MLLLYISKLNKGNNMPLKENVYYSGGPCKPILLDRENPALLRDHADAMEAWTSSIDMWGELKDAYRRSLRSRRNELQRDLAIENDMTVTQAGVLFNVAWEDGHSEGIAEVVYRFDQLVEIIENFTQAGDEK
jgi:hypothetical protein